jgi:hypothetical protein
MKRMFDSVFVPRRNSDANDAFNLLHLVSRRDNAANTGKNRLSDLEAFAGFAAGGPNSDYRTLLMYRGFRIDGAESVKPNIREARYYERRILKK